MPDPVAETLSKAAAPNYENLIRFLVQPFLESPAALKLDCEVSQSRARVWIRLAFEGSDKGRVFGRGGRNIQAIRTVLERSRSWQGTQFTWMSTADLQATAMMAQSGKTRQNDQIPVVRHHGGVLGRDRGKGLHGRGANHSVAQY